MSRLTAGSFLRSRWTFAVILLGALSIGLAYTLFIRPERQFYSIPVAVPTTPPADWSQEIRIGVVGDSWVASAKLDSFLTETLAQEGLVVEVDSFGMRGAKSYQIVANLLADEPDTSRLREILADPDIDYVVLVAGVNDSAGHVGADSYAHHMGQLVEAVRQQGSFPVVVELPEYGIEALPTRSVMSAVKLGLLRWLFDSGEIDVIARYRQTLAESVEPLVQHKQLAVVGFDQVCADYESSLHLYKDPSHLNQEGSQRLAEAIARSLLATHRERLVAPTASN
jgi:lysophospholipase L1-like esterase